MAMSYNNRQSRGNNRSTLNDGVARIPGIYNEGAEVEITAVGPNQQESIIQNYDFFNLNANTRTAVM